MYEVVFLSASVALNVTGSDVKLPVLDDRIIIHILEKLVEI